MRELQLKDIIITSVVPQVMYSITNMIKKYFGGKSPLIVGENLPFPIVNRYDNPHEVGADRLVAAIAAYRKYGGPAIVVDFGTATTFDAVAEDGRPIWAALSILESRFLWDALFQKASKLPRVELVDPGTVIGRNTVQSMQAGAVYGYVGAVKNIVGLMRVHLGEKTKVIATGGLSKMIGRQSGLFDYIDKALTLEGLVMIYEMYKNKESNTKK